MNAGDSEQPLNQPMRRSRKPKWMRRIIRQNWTDLALNVVRYGALPVTMGYILYYTEPEPTFLSMVNPFI